MKKKNIHFIVNPVSGIGKQKVIEKQIEEHLDKSKYEYRVIYTKTPGHATELSKEAVQSNVNILVAVGGDGSVNEIARGLIGTDTVLGIIPTGSGNGLAHHLNIPGNYEQAFKIINKEKSIKIDTASINNTLFVSIAGIGFDALVAKKFAKSKKRGFLTYLRIVTEKYAGYKPKKYKLEIDGEKIKTKALFISFANSDQFGYNAAIAPKAKIDDGLLDVCIVQKAPLIEIPFLAHLLYWKKIDRSKYIKVIKAKHVKVIRKKNKTINIDGEPVKLSKKLNVKIMPLSLKIIVP
ncbi:MAG: diacylglycerol kinase family lipid kinase [Bacteroidales bacterium]|nr:diacylglycerol kinase family lipid kinase [Bacteroidales bacterium]